MPTKSEKKRLEEAHAANNWENEVVTSWEASLKIDSTNLIKLLKHFEKMNRSRSNDLSRDDNQRKIDEGRADSYSFILFCVRQNILITK